MNEFDSKRIRRDKAFFRNGEFKVSVRNFLSNQKEQVKNNVPTRRHLLNNIDNFRPCAEKISTRTLGQG